MSEDVKPVVQSEYLRVKEAAVYWGVSRRTVWRMIAAGQLKAARLRGCTLLLRSQVLGYFNGNGKVGGV
jgi:excisionase family DNA binding protein